MLDDIVKRFIIISASFFGGWLGHLSQIAQILNKRCDFLPEQLAFPAIGIETVNSSGYPQQQVQFILFSVLLAQAVFVQVDFFGDFIVPDAVRFRYIVFSFYLGNPPSLPR